LVVEEQEFLQVLILMLLEVDLDQIQFFQQSHQLEVVVEVVDQVIQQET
tara:strand:- start:440 stop:586 length:147 start_codon:yes stop_codon:yes gene_type:complete